MRIKQLLIFLLISVNVFAYNGEDYKVTDISWTSTDFVMTSTKNDATIAKGKAKIEFEIKLSDGCTNGRNIQYSLDGGTLSTIPEINKNKKFSLLVKAGNHKFEFHAVGCSSVLSDTVDFSSQSLSTVVLTFRDDAPVITFKPVIYLYPEKETKVNVQFDYKGQLEFTYPKYPNEGWDVNAFPDGTLEIENKKYNYLFWDGKMNPKLFDFEKSEGSIVKSTNLVSFFESSLTTMGLNTKEIQDFITFWAPKMISNEQNYIHFLFTTEYDQVSTIKVNPKPDNMLRIYMIWSDVSNLNIDPLVEQSFPQFKRIGFTLVEWGGSELPEFFDKITN